MDARRVRCRWCVFTAPVSSTNAEGEQVNGLDVLADHAYDAHLAEVEAVQRWADESSGARARLYS